MTLFASLLCCLSVPSVILFSGDLVLCLTGIARTFNVKREYRKSSELKQQIYSCAGKYDLVCINATVVGVG